MSTGVMIIAEVGSNWRGAPEEPLAGGAARARRLIEGAHASGANVVKFQVFRRTLYPDDHPGHALLAANELPRDWLPVLTQACRDCGIEFLATPFDLEAVSLLDPLVARWKISSYELRHRQLLRAVGATGKPVLLSTGMATLADTHQAWLECLHGWRTLHPGRPYPLHVDAPITLLHCVSAYPAAAAQMNLRTLAGSRSRMGLSDHTAPPSVTAAVIAVALGAHVIETHITEDQGLQGPDHHFARTLDDLRHYVAAIREAEQMLGDGRKRPMPGEDIHARWNPATGRRGGWENAFSASTS